MWSERPIFRELTPLQHAQPVRYAALLRYAATAAYAADESVVDLPGTQLVTQRCTVFGATVFLGNATI